MGNTYSLDLEWENGVEFQLKSTKNQDTPIVIIKTEENEHYTVNRGNIEAICRSYFDLILKEIGDEMIT